jgi:hypothetical protein
MAKYSIFLASFLIILGFFAGCPPTESEALEPEKTEVTEQEWAMPAPVQVEPNESKHIQAESAVTEPNIAETIPAKQPQAEVTPVKPNSVKADSNEPDIIEANDVKPAVTEPNIIEPESTQPRPKVTFHDKCADIFSQFVNIDGLVDYMELRRKRLQLKDVLDEFDMLDPNEYRSWPREDKISFWINAYNIQMLNIIIQNYPIEASRWLTIFYGPYSIRHIKGIWTDYKFMVMDEEFTLSEVEQRFFRKTFDDPRVFLAIFQASLSSPPLRNEPYYGDKLEEQLEEQTKRFLSSPNGFRIARNEQTVYMSAIFQPTWHGKDFISKFGTDKKFKDQQPAIRAALNFISNYISEQDVSFLEVGNYSVKHIKYDWTLNDNSRRP